MNARNDFRSVCILALLMGSYSCSAAQPVDGSDSASGCAAKSPSPRRELVADRATIIKRREPARGNFIDATTYLDIVADANREVRFDTDECRFDLTKAQLPTARSVYACGIKLARAHGVHPCFVVVALNNESLGRVNAHGNDANVTLVGDVIPQSRVSFLRSRKKHSGAAFHLPVEFPSDCSDAMHEHCVQLVRQTSSVINDDGLDPWEPDYGLDWRYSHGIGLKQITIFGQSTWCKAGIPSRQIGDTCYTLRELFLPVPALIAGLTFIQSAGGDAHPSYGTAHRVWVAYAGKDNANALDRVQQVMACTQLADPLTYRRRETYAYDE